ncbi:MAG TPA: dienelactone hydrolase family protein [Actinomycetes bacterium]|jgi:carboxymethylenebutenolidase|nr:dienelactone hydrolase family protein [Actinomycetes bacterium]
MADVSIASGQGPLPGYLATPTAGGPWPGVVVIHEAFGLNDDIRRIADRFAAHGYLALAPDFFAWGSRPACVRAAFRELVAGSGRMFDELDDARTYLAGLADCSGQVGVIGFCLGGGFALLAAPRGFGASSVNYGRVPDDAERLLAGACPIIASYGGRDRQLRAHPGKLDRALTALGVEHDVKVYPEAGHSFLNHHSGALAMVLERVFGVGHHGPSAEDAWQRILAFFDAHLRAGAQASGEG